MSVVKITYFEMYEPSIKSLRIYSVSLGSSKKRCFRWNFCSKQAKIASLLKNDLFLTQNDLKSYHIPINILKPTFVILTGS